MNQKIQSLLFYTAIILQISVPGKGQSISNIDVNNISSSQINQAKQAIQSSGLSIDQAVAEARKRGASEAQIQQMIQRMQAGQKTTETTVQPDESAELLVEQDSLNRMNQQRFMGPEKDQVKVNQNFGAYLFNSQNLTFEPNLNIQTPKNYEVNIGDEILINIWGNSIENYQLEVNRNGQIQIPQIGPIFIAGQSFEEATKLIKRRLTSIYADMGGNNPNTFAQVSMGRLRSIRINMAGEVSAPGTYTLPATASVFNALYLSGGPAEYGSFRQIEIHRDNKLLKNIDLYDFLMKGDQSGDISLKNQDLIFIPIAPIRVKASGQFKRNNYFELKEDESLADLIQYAGGFADSAYRENIKIYRKIADGIEIIDVPTLSAKNFLPLHDGDEILASKISTRIENQVTITGSVFRPGEYQWIENMTLRDLIMKADSIVPNAMVEMGQITRFNPDYTLSQISFNVTDVLSGETNIMLESKDEVQIKSIYELMDKPTITVDGRVRKGGSFDFKTNMSLLDAIYLAGGFREDADSTYVQISRRLSKEEATLLTDKLVDVFNIPVPRILDANDPSTNFKLEPYDHIYIRKSPGYSDQGRVFIGGEVIYAGFYAIQSKKDRLSDLIVWAGGITPEGYPDGASFSKVDAGKVGLDLQKVIANPGSLNDLLLSPGDSLYIPKRPETVNVFGQVQNPFASVFVPGKSVKYYIKQSGGWGESPHKRRVYVTYPDGSSDMTYNFIIWRFPKVKPGTQIHVPKKPERKSGGETLATILATASTAASLGIAVATLANLINK